MDGGRIPSSCNLCHDGQPIDLKEIKKYLKGQGPGWRFTRRRERLTAIGDEDMNTGSGNKRYNVVFLDRQQRDNNAMLEQVLSQHGDTLRRFLRLRLAHEADREDIVQELLLKLSRVDDLADKLAEHSGNTRYYLFSILTNLIVDRQRYAVRRKSGLHDSFDDNHSPPQQDTPESIVATQEQLGRAVQLLKRMKPQYRQVFLLSRLHYKSYPQIATELGISESSVERYMSIVLEKLRKGLAREQS